MEQCATDQRTRRESNQRQKNTIERLLFQHERKTADQSNAAHQEAENNDPSQRRHTQLGGCE